MNASGRRWGWRWRLVLCLGFAALFGGRAMGNTPVVRVELNDPSSTLHPSPGFVAAAAGAVPGQGLAKAITEITGVAISPLLGTSVIGAWRYFEVPKDQRSRLPWYAQPWYWGPALIVVGLAFAKDALGPITPTALKKPMDIAEVMENKVSGLVAAGAFVPFVVGAFGELPGTASAGLAGAGLAAATASTWVNMLLTPFAMIAFVVVWLLGHVIHVLILVSPFTTVDTVLKLARTALLGTLVGASFVDERIGAIWAVAILLLGTFLAGWSFRLSVMGTVFLWDVLSRRRRWFEPDPEANGVFLAREIGEAPVRTYGRLARTQDGALKLSYRPFLVGQAKELVLTKGTYCVGRGLIYADLLRWDGAEWVRVGILPPRYKGHEEALTRIYRLEPPADVGLRAIWRFIQELLGFGEASRPGLSGG